MRSLLVLLALLVACSDPEPALSSATSLHCPAPGALPFRLASRGFQTSTNKTIATDDPRDKAEASDTIGNPGGAIASVYLADDQSPATAALDYRGVKARSAADNGVTTARLAGENVSLWFYDATKAAWQPVGRGKTDADGVYDLPTTGVVAPNGQPVYAVLEADGSCAAHFTYLFSPGSKVVVTDIDGTLTHDDLELNKQIMDANYDPVLMGAADKLTQAWAMKGYPVIYLTARPNLLRVETRHLLDDLGFAPGPLITENSSAAADVYKTLWLDRMIHSFGWTVVAAYGNASTDVRAYKNVGIPKDRMFIVGGYQDPDGGVTDIPGLDFTQHIATFVAAQPPSQ